MIWKGANDMATSEINRNTVESSESGSVWVWLKEWGFRLLDRMGRSEVY
jgi:hypothetical protein